MPSYTGTVTCEHPPEAVFAYLSAFEHTAEWDPNCDRAERIGDAVPGLGTNFTLVFKPMGPLETTFQYEIVEFDAPHRVVLKGSTGSVSSVDTITVEPRAGGGSEVTYVAELGVSGAGRILNPVASLGLQRAGKQAEEGLAERLKRPLGGAPSARSA